MMGKRKWLTAGQIYGKHADDVDAALEEIDLESEKRVQKFADWLIDRKTPEEMINSHCNNIYFSQLVITQHEPPYMFLEEAKDDITKKKIKKAESYGFLFKYHVFLDAIKETQVDEDYFKALRTYFDYLVEKGFIASIPKVVRESLEKEDVYLRRLREYHAQSPENEDKWMKWWGRWCKEVFDI